MDSDEAPGLFTAARADIGDPVEPARAGALRVEAVEGEDGVVDLAGERLETPDEEPAEEREAAPGGGGFLIEADMADVRSVSVVDVVAPSR